MPVLYSFLLYLVLPFALLRLWWRGAQLPGYRAHWKERLGILPFRPGESPIWLHAVSVGEVRAAEPLVRAIREQWPGVPLLLTTTTPTGRETIRQLYGDTVYCAWLPWDLPGAVQRFLRGVQPRFAVILETEIWPNLFSRLQLAGVPLYLVNARLSEKSMKGYRRFAPLVTRTMHCVTCIAARSEEDAQRFRQLGASEAQLVVTGDLKLDYDPPDDTETRYQTLRSRIGERPVWVAGSTHAGEESMLLEAHRQLLRSHPDALLVIAPRHPERAPQLVNLCRQSGLRYGLFSDPESIDRRQQVLVLDVLGELVFLYGIATAAFIGGSLVERGGHNPVEAAVAGAAIASGPAWSNFMAIYQALISAGAVRLVSDPAELAAFVQGCLDDPAIHRRYVEAALQVIDENRGAVKRTMALLTH